MGKWQGRALAAVVLACFLWAAAAGDVSSKGGAVSLSFAENPLGRRLLQGGATSPTVVPAQTVPASSGGGDSWGRKNFGWIIAVAIVVFLLLQIPLCAGVYCAVKWFFHQQAKIKGGEERASLHHIPLRGDVPAPSSDRVNVRDLLPKPTKQATVRYFSWHELEEATHDFSKEQLLGSGGSGEVYRGRLEDGTIVAIKKRIPSREGVLPQFENEAQILSKLAHPNLVTLLGWCDEDEQQALVFPYLTNGSLERQLEKEGRTLGWTTRIRIAIGAATGLEFLHACNIIHRDVKSSNVLLDHEFNAKVSDCGISRNGPGIGSTHVSTGVKGTIGYLDPEYYLYHQLTAKSDVYSFGVVLVEIITGKMPIDLQRTSKQQNLLMWAKPKLEAGHVAELLDARLAGLVDPDSLNQVTAVALECLHDNSKKRPTMAEVRGRLQESLEVALAAVQPTRRRKSGMVIDVDGKGMLDSSEGSSLSSFGTGEIILDSMGSTFGSLVTPKPSEPSSSKATTLTNVTPRSTFT